MLLCVPPSSLDLWWEQVAPLLQRVVDRGGGGQNVATIRADLLSGQKHLWLIVDGTVTSATVTFTNRCPDGSWELRLSASAGHDLQAMADGLDQIEAWAASERIARARIDGGRPGWGRVLRGYREIGRSYIKELH